MVFAEVRRIVTITNESRMGKGNNKYQNRRDFVRKTGKILVAAPLVFIPAVLAKKTYAKGHVWQIDPLKCTTCGQCKTHCVLTPSAVKCTHKYEMCGYCDLCGGYLRQGVRTISTGAENQICPVGAIKRVFIEEPYFEYTIDEELCDGCAKCVRGCLDFGNGSLYMQIRHDLCVNCNECSIARACPSNAVSRVSVDAPYNIKDRIGPL